MTMILRAILVALLAVAGLSALSAQDASFTLKVDVAMVSVDVGVFDASGKPVSGLTKDDFVVEEDGQRQEIRSFASSDDPYNILLVIDRSGSMHSEFRFLLDAVNRFMRNLRTQDMFALAAFDRSVKKLVNWRSVRAGSQKTIQLGAGGDTDFYKALDWASDELRKVRGRKAALFYTDGEDHRTYDPAIDAKAFKRAMQTVGRANAPFHFVGLAVDPQRGGAHLRQLAELTGGRVHFPDSVEGLVPLYDQISRELGNSYTLGYQSNNTKRDGANRSIQVTVPGGAYRVSQSRTSYSGGRL